MPEFISQTLDGKAAADWRGVQEAASRWPYARIKVQEYSDEIKISERQMKWLHGAAIPHLAEKWGRSKLWVEIYLKLACGADLFTAKEVTVQKHSFWVTSSKTQLSRKQARTWIENILDHKPCEDAGLEPPDPNWRKKKEPTPLFET